MNSKTTHIKDGEQKNKRSFYYSSNKYSATGGTGGGGAFYSGANSF